MNVLLLASRLISERLAGGLIAWAEADYRR